MSSQGYTVNQGDVKAVEVRGISEIAIKGFRGGANVMFESDEDITFRSNDGSIRYELSDGKLTIKPTKARGAVQSRSGRSINISAGNISNSVITNGDYYAGVDKASARDSSESTTVMVWIPASLLGRVKIRIGKNTINTIVD